MSVIKVLVADNDVFVRRFFFNVLDSYQFIDIKIINDFEKLPSFIENGDYDIAFVNIDENGGIAADTFRTLINQNPGTLFVAMAERTETGGGSIIRALNLGAVDFITIPEKHTSVLLAHNHFEKRIGDIIENVILLKTDRIGDELFLLTSRKRKLKPARVVILASGSEGIKTLHSMLRRLPGSLASPMIVVSSFPKIFTKKLAESLNKDSELVINEAFDGARLLEGSVWIIPGGQHGEIVRRDSSYYIRLHSGPRENGMRPSVDVIFRSAARNIGEGALGVLLSGYGNDGIFGAMTLKNQGGEIIIQEPEELFAAKLLTDSTKAGLVDQICSEEDIAIEILKRVQYVQKRRKKETAHKYDIA